MTITEVDLPAGAPRRHIGDALRRPSTIVRVLLSTAVVVFLLYYVGPTAIGSTMLKVVLAVVLSVAIFVGANLLFDLTYDRWTVFLTVCGFAVGAFGFLLLDGNHILRDLSPRPWLWTLIGGVAGAVVMFALGTRRALAGPALAALSFAALGVLLADAIDDSKHPALDWTKLLITATAGVVAFGGRRALSAVGRAEPERILRSALVGGGVGWLIGAWGGAEFPVVNAETGALTGGGNVGDALIATVIPLAVIGAAFGLAGEPTPTDRRNVEQRSRPWIFATPALLFIAGGLLAPLVRTIVISFKDRDSIENVGFANYYTIFTNRGFFSAADWVAGNVLGSKLLWVAAGFVALGLALGLISGRRRQAVFDRSPGSVALAAIGVFLASCFVLSTLSGTVINNIWWVVVVTTLTTAFGLAVAVLADRAKGENIAKSLIFLPMAISFVGAGVIWTFVYSTRNPRKPQTGLLNAIWVGIGELSNSGWQKSVVAVVMALVIAGLAYLAWDGVRIGNATRAGFSIGFAVVVAVLLYLLLVPGIGGYEVTSSGELRAKTIDFIREPRYNNMWLMVVLIWIQTGFAMVIFSSAIKAVPAELTEAARIDGADEPQIFWQVTLPQIAPTVGVVVTTLIVTVMKVYDVVKVMTGGDFSTQVIANQMIETINRDNNLGTGATLAVLLFVAVLPVMVFNIRRMQRAK